MNICLFNIIMAFSTEFFLVIMNNDIFVTLQVASNIPVQVKLIVSFEVLQVISGKIMFSWYLFTATLRHIPREHNLQISRAEALLVLLCQY
jgi:hypothetical protein